ncbi:DUF4199 domain-containing protein [Maribacter sp. 2210JD10-5]|uniref:DUF4199 domain-containing protein n=1 Tax=Maribacter sp. 2210JD10-5 TaxID=3386272 RepID=UPI0039BD4EFC
MKKTIVHFGIYAFLCAFLLFMAALYFGQGLDFSIQEVLGYLTILTSLLFIFFAIKHLREKENHGLISFKKAFLIGISISVFAGIGFAIADTIYVTVINPDFAEQYLAYSLEKLKAELPAATYEVERKKLLEQIEQYKNPAFNATVMFMTVFLIGFIITLISALILQRKN